MRASGGRKGGIPGFPPSGGRKGGIPGFTLVELLLVLTLFTLVSVVGYHFLSQSVTLWRRVSETETASLELEKAGFRLRSDLASATRASMAVGDVPSSLGAAPDGGALWFLSAVDPASGELVRTPEGEPFWQSNVLYYLVVPADHRRLFGYDCTGGAGPAGLDDRCPHKILLRKVIDSGVPTTPTGDPGTETETLLADPSPYLTRPTGYDTKAMAAEPGLESVKVVASKLLYFAPRLGPDPAFPGEVVLDLRAAAIRDAEKHVQVGVTTLAQGRFTLQLLDSVFPEN